MLARRLTRAALWTLAALTVLILAAFLWLRQSPYWAGITLFSESYRVENFRAMDRVFPARPVPRGEDIWAFRRAPTPLPETYTFGGEARELIDFLDHTETTGLLVVHRGALTREEYRQGADETSPFTSWSMAKSVLSALIGIAVEEGQIASIRHPIGAYVPALAASGYANVPIGDALTMSSGVGFDEDYDNPLSDINVLFIRAMAMGVPVEETLADLDRVRDPGTYDDYVSSDSMALGLVLEAATGMAPADYLARRLWGPMGAEADATWSTDRTGREFTLCCLNATAPHLLPGGNPASFWTFGYGYQWWIPENPQDDFLAIGVWGQYIYFDPLREVVIVKTSADPLFDDNDHESVAAFRAIARTVAGD